MRNHCQLEIFLVVACLLGGILGPLNPTSDTTVTGLRVNISLTSKIKCVTEQKWNLYKKEVIRAVYDQPETIRLQVTID